MSKLWQPYALHILDAIEKVGRIQDRVALNYYGHLPGQSHRHRLSEALEQRMGGQLAAQRICKVIRWQRNALLLQRGGYSKGK